MPLAVPVESETDVILLGSCPFLTLLRENEMDEKRDRYTKELQLCGEKNEDSYCRIRLRDNSGSHFWIVYLFFWTFELQPNSDFYDTPINTVADELWSHPTV